MDATDLPGWRRSSGRADGPADHPTDGLADRLSDRSPDHPPDRGPERPAERPPERVTERLVGGWLPHAGYPDVPGRSPDRGRDPAELLDQLRERLDRLPPSHPSARTRSPDRSSDLASRDTWPAGRDARPSVSGRDPEPDERSAERDGRGDAEPDASETEPDGGGDAGGQNSRGADRGHSDQRSDHADGGSGWLAPGQARSGAPYRPWFTDAGPGEPWFAANPLDSGPDLD